MACAVLADNGTSAINLADVVQTGFSLAKITRGPTITRKEQGAMSTIAETANGYPVWTGIAIRAIACPSRNTHNSFTSVCSRMRRQVAVSQRTFGGQSDKKPPHAVASDRCRNALRDRCRQDGRSGRKIRSDSLRAVNQSPTSASSGVNLRTMSSNIPVRVTSAYWSRSPTPAWTMTARWR